MQPELPEELRSVLKVVTDEIWRLNTTWDLYQGLYRHSEARVNLLRETDAYVFGLLQNVLLRDIASAICRLIDPPKHGSATSPSNATLSYLLNPELTGVCLYSVHSNITYEYFRNRTESRFLMIRKWRNKRLSHNDLDTLVGHAESPLVTIRHLRNAVRIVNYGIRLVYDRVLQSDLHTSTRHFHDGCEAFFDRLEFAHHDDDLFSQWLLKRAIKS